MVPDTRVEWLLTAQWVLPSREEAEAYAKNLFAKAWRVEAVRRKPDREPLFLP